MHGGQGGGYRQKLNITVPRSGRQMGANVATRGGMRGRISHAVILVSRAGIQHRLVPIRLERVRGAFTILLGMVGSGPRPCSNPLPVSLPWRRILSTLPTFLMGATMYSKVRHRLLHLDSSVAVFGIGSGPIIHSCTRGSVAWVRHDEDGNVRFADTGRRGDCRAVAG